MIIRNSIHDSSIKRRKYSIEEIKNRIIDEPIRLLSTEYRNAHEKLLWKCLKCGETWKANWHNISFGKKCPNCRHLKAMKANRKKMPTNDEIKLFLLKKNINWIGINYKNAHTKLELECLVCGNIWNNDFHHLKGQNAGCPKCSIPRGENHPRWKGNSHNYYGYPRQWTDELKEIIRNRDNRKCQYPSCKYNDTKRKQKLHVHHIDGDKKNCDEANLISLCNNHHMKIEANNPREWDEYFLKITKRYDKVKVENED